MVFEGTFLFDKKWNGKVYDNETKETFEIINGNGIVIEYNYDDLIYKGEYINKKKSGQGKEY